MTAYYDNLDVQFVYPENWQVTDEHESQWPRTVTVQSPETAFWSLHIYPLPLPEMDLPGEVVQALRDEYGDVEVQEVQTEVAGHSATGYQMAFHCLDLIVRARVLMIATPGRAFVILCQAEDREFERLDPVFLAITTSLLQSGGNGRSANGEPPTG